MNSRERVLTVFGHEEPDRVPMWCGASTEFWDKAKKELGLGDEELRVRFHDDFRRVFAEFKGPDAGLSEGATQKTVFGIERHGVGFGQPMTNPLADADLKLVNAYPWPDPKWVDVSKVGPEARKYNKQYAILGGDWSPLWHDTIDMMGMENMMIKMYTEPEVVKAVVKHIADYYFDVNVRIFEAAGADLDIFFIGNDLGSQTGPLLGRELFREFILPALKRLIDLGHQYKLKVMMHCCGGFYPLIPDLIDAGLDGLHAIQTTCAGMDLKTLKAEFGDKMVFNGGIDSHHVLIDGNVECVKQQTKEVLKVMMPGGGYIAGASHDWILEETPVENITAMFDTVYEAGRYAR